MIGMSMTMDMQSIYIRHWVICITILIIITGGTDGDGVHITIGTLPIITIIIGAIMAIIIGIHTIGMLTGRTTELCIPDM